jgi:hypothetical protein
VNLSTVHRSKGLEWPHVFVVRCNEGMLPNVFIDHSADTSTCDIAEERRIAYVAMSRARVSLHLTCVLKDASGIDMELSRFLLELPEDKVLFVSPIQSDAERRAQRPDQQQQQQQQHVQHPQQHAHRPVPEPMQRIMPQPVKPLALPNRGTQIPASANGVKLEHRPAAPTLPSSSSSSKSTSVWKTPSAPAQRTAGVATPGAAVPPATTPRAVLPSSTPAVFMTPMMADAPPREQGMVDFFGLVTASPVRNTAVRPATNPRTVDARIGGGKGPDTFTPRSLLPPKTSTPSSNAGSSHSGSRSSATRPQSQSQSQSQSSAAKRPYPTAPPRGLFGSRKMLSLGGLGRKKKA